MQLSSDPPYPKAINRLDSETRKIVLSLLSHPIVSRLKAVQQLGFTSRVFAPATHSRWDHTLWTIGMLCGLLDAAPPLPKEVRQHLLAACVLQDIGHSPFSNSLGPAFSRRLTDERLSLLVPQDKVRTILILEHVEKVEQLFTRLGLTVEILIQLLVGRFPWSKHAWASRLIEGVLDADRLAYVEQDSQLTLGRKVHANLRLVMRSLLSDGPHNVAIIATEGIDHVKEFINTRATLTLQVYHHLQKLGWEFVVRDILFHAWADAKKRLGILPLEPSTVPEFLDWNDETVELLLERAASFEGSPTGEALRLLGDRQLLVGEVEEVDGQQSMSFGDIDTILGTVDCPTFPAAPIWIIKAKDIPLVSIYEHDSILVKSKGKHQPLDALSTSLSSAATRLRHRPMIVFGTTHVELVMRTLYDRKLTLLQLQPLGQV